MKWIYFYFKNKPFSFHRFFLFKNLEMEKVNKYILIDNNLIETGNMVKSK